MYYLKLATGLAIWGWVVAATPLPSSGRHISKQVRSRSSPAQTHIKYHTAGRGTQKPLFKDRESEDNGDDDDDDDDNDDDDDEEEPLMPGDFLEGDNDSGGESDIGNDAVSVANGLFGSGGAGSAALNGLTEGSTSVFCSLFACAAASQSDGKTSTTAAGANINVKGSVIVNITGPLLVVNLSKG